VVFCHRRAVAEHFAEKVPGAYIHGGLTQKARDAVIETRPKMLAVTYDVASVGIDLSYADVGVGAELDYRPWILAQMEARLFRYGQARPTLVQYCIAQGTADELIRAKVIDKLATIEAAVGDDVGKLGASLGGQSEDDALEALWHSL
jgi:SNF2 family DNA or RNA helicase